MQIDDYQMLSQETAKGYADPHPDDIPEDYLDREKQRLFVVTGAAGETGELAEKVKKDVRGDDIDVSEIRREIGDVVWYLAQLASMYDIALSDALEENIDKLQDRDERDVITGAQGDDR